MAVASVGFGRYRMEHVNERGQAESLAEMAEPSTTSLL
jgi:hypothetical protein